MFHLYPPRPKFLNPGERQPLAPDHCGISFPDVPGRGRAGLGYAKSPVTELQLRLCDVLWVMKCEGVWAGSIWAAE